CPRPPARWCRTDSQPRPLTSFSTYFAITSTSRFTGSPTSLCPNVVSLSVVGINPTANPPASTSTTVSDTPSTAIEPLSTTYRVRPGGSSKWTVSQVSPGTRRVIRPT